MPIHTHTHRCVNTGWALGLLKASARGGWEIDHPPTANNNNNCAAKPQSCYYVLIKQQTPHAYEHHVPFVLFLQLDGLHVNVGELLSGCDQFRFQRQIVLRKTGVTYQQTVFVLRQVLHLAYTTSPELPDFRDEKLPSTSESSPTPSSPVFTVVTILTRCSL